MQCRNCQFENLPGSSECGRCGSSLRLSTTVIDVHPPRARPWVKSLRRLFPLQRGFFRLRDGLTAAAGGVVGAWNEHRPMTAMPVPEVLLRLIVPGWAHSYLGLTWRARFFFIAFAVLVILSILFWGSTLGSVFLGLAFSIHASATIDIILQSGTELGTRLLCGFFVAIFLGLVYYPVGWFVSRTAAPRMIETSAGPFKDGDVVLVNSWRAPQPGSVVLFRKQGLDTLTQVRGIPIRFVGGEFIDRILAGPGSEVAWKNGELWVDGKESSWKPLTPITLPSSFKMTVPKDAYLIFPSTVRIQMPHQEVNNNQPVELPASVWKVLGSVPAHDVLGVVYWRHQPLNRLGPIR